MSVDTERAGWKRMERGCISVYVYADIRDKHPRQTNKKEEDRSPRSLDPPDVYHQQKGENKN